MTPRSAAIHLKHPRHPPAPAPGLADTFATLLAVEQGELPASALLASAALRR